VSAELEEVRNTWEHLGSTDPYWAVLTENDFHAGEARKKFFESGRTEVREMLHLLQEMGHDLGSQAVDFGCGVGRLSFALAEHMDQVIGIDVAQSMLREAAANNPFVDHVRFVHNESSDLPFADNSVDLVVSSITLQHIPPSLSIRYLLEMVRITKPGGHLLFQMPSHIPAPVPIPAESCLAAVTIKRAPTTLAANECGYVWLSIRNDSTETWPVGQLLNAGNHWYRGGIPVRWDDGRASMPCPIAPGDSAEVMLRVTAPAESGDYELAIDLVQEHVAWWSDLGGRLVRHPIAVRQSAVTAADPADAASVSTAIEPTAALAAEPAEPRATTSRTMQMHGVRKDLVCALLHQLGCTILKVLPDNRAGNDWASYFYVVEVGEYRLELG
jgi:ubiquinone/menaquinone biosynthesis C-methylase UbiE